MYELHWITDHLATGHAPMSYDELDAIRAQGISAIVNLCGEFCDLHEIEDTSGFDVHYLPVVDEHAPDLEAMERALDWMDEAIYLDKKVLVHCRMGHGRTGTFIAAYLLRRGFDFKAAERTMKGRKAVPATYDQRRFLKKYGKQVGPLRTAAPRIDNRPATAVDTVITAYHDLLARFPKGRHARQLAAMTLLYVAGHEKERGLLGVNKERLKLIRTGLSLLGDPAAAGQPAQPECSGSGNPGPERRACRHDRRSRPRRHDRPGSGSPGQVSLLCVDRLSPPRRAIAVCWSNVSRIAMRCISGFSPPRAGFFRI